MMDPLSYFLFQPMLHNVLTKAKVLSVGWSR